MTRIALSKICSIDHLFQNKKGKHFQYNWFPSVKPLVYIDVSFSLRSHWQLSAMAVLLCVSCYTTETTLGLLMHLHGLSKEPTDHTSRFQRRTCLAPALKHFAPPDSKSSHKMEGGWARDVTSVPVLFQVVSLSWWIRRWGSHRYCVCTARGEAYFIGRACGQRQSFPSVNTEAKSACRHFYTAHLEVCISDDFPFSNELFHLSSTPTKNPSHGAMLSSVRLRGGSWVGSWCRPMPA